MLELTESARKELEAFFAGKEKGAIRIYLAPGGCCGPRLALALDAATDQDLAEEQGGFAFCINKDLLAQVQGVTIDATRWAFPSSRSCPCPRAAAVAAVVPAAAAATRAL